MEMLADKLGDKMTTDMSLLSVKKLSGLHQKNQKQQAQMEKRLVMAQKSTHHLRSNLGSRHTKPTSYDDPMGAVDDVTQRSRVGCPTWLWLLSKQQLLCYATMISHHAA